MKSSIRGKHQESCNISPANLFLGKQRNGFLLFCTDLFYSSGDQHLRDKCMKNQTDLGEVIPQKQRLGNHIIHSNLKSTCISLNICCRTFIKGKKHSFWDVPWSVQFSAHLKIKRVLEIRHVSPALWCPQVGPYVTTTQTEHREQCLCAEHRSILESEGFGLPSVRLWRIIRLYQSSPDL